MLALTCILVLLALMYSAGKKPDQDEERQYTQPSQNLALSPAKDASDQPKGHKGQKDERQPISDCHPCAIDPFVTNDKEESVEQHPLDYGKCLGHLNPNAACPDPKQQCR